ncbi:MAG: hypothetical protein IPK07_27905 [Deltaproteobacteria bacterium]|nr:hypothetical protein [Deltaproteobacteria bacterium]
MERITRSLPGGASGLATGEFTRPSIEYPPIPLEPSFTHVLTFTMEPMAPPTRSAIRTNGPLIVFTDDLDVVVFSPVDHPFETLVWLADGALHSGLEGELDTVPPGFTHEFLVVRGRGINATMERWGRRCASASAARSPTATRTPASPASATGPTTARSTTTRPRPA